MFNKDMPDEVRYKDIFLQVDSRQSIDRLAIGLYITQFIIGLAKGDMAIMSIEVGHKPSADREQEDNNRKLEFIVHPFKAVFIGGPGGSDGNVTWPHDWEEGPNVRERAFHNIYQLPLEVGSCDVLSLWSHTCRSRGWARWPYYSKYVYMLAVKREVL